MKKILVFLLSFVGTIYGGIKKQEPLPNVTADVQLFDEKEDVLLQPFVEAQVGQTIGFRLRGKIQVAILEQRIKTSTNGLLFIGTFFGQKDAGFVFEFQPLPDKSVHISGLLFFDELNVYYTLEFDEKTKTIFFLERNTENGAPTELAKK